MNQLKIMHGAFASYKVMHIFSVSHQRKIIIYSLLERRHFHSLVATDL